MTLIDIYAKYEAVQKDLEACETQADELRKQKAAVAQQILDEHGSGPHELGSRKLIVTRGRGGAPFLREAPSKKSKAAD
jgi:hypothetical protein